MGLGCVHPVARDVLPIASTRFEQKGSFIPNYIGKTGFRGFGGVPGTNIDVRSLVQALLVTDLFFSEELLMKRVMKSRRVLMMKSRA